MKIKFTLFTAALFLAFNSYSQCNMSIFPSPGHIKITSDTSINATGGVYWICGGLTVNILSSPGSAYYLEPNVTLNIIDSDGDGVWAKDGCIINNSSDQDIGVAVNPSTVTLNNTGSGSITIAYNCTAVTYDYSMVGGGPCIINSVDEISAPDISLYPNPVKKDDVITIGSPAEVSLVEIFDITGKLVKKEEGSIRSISTTGLNAGYYVVQLSKENYSGKIRIIIY